MGGTIDSKPYSEVPGEYPPNATMNQDYLAARTLRDDLYGDPDIETLKWIIICNKDSKKVTDADRAKLLRYIKEAQGKFDRIVVTMGTDCMAPTAKFLKENMGEILCPIIFTGAIWPLSNGKKSDGWENLSAAAYKPVIKPNVYIAMGDVFAPAEFVVKDFERKCFIDIRKSHTGVAIPTQSL